VLLDRLKRSPYYEPDHTKADLFWIPHQASMPRAGDESQRVDTGGSVFWARSHALFAPQMPFRGHNWTTEAYGLIRSQWPYLNRSIEANQTRHFITLTCDQGPGSCEYANRELMRLGSLPSFWNPADPSRVIGAS
jgi:hypothetical protein